MGQNDPRFDLKLLQKNENKLGKRTFAHIVFKDGYGYSLPS